MRFLMISLRVSLLPPSSRAVLRPNSLPLQPLPRRLRHQGRYKQRARCVPFCYSNSVIMQSISITSLCLCMCRNAGELNFSSVMVLLKGVCSLFKPLKLRLALHFDTRLGQESYESYIILRDRIVVGLVKSLNQGLWLHIRIHFTPLNQ